jgi:predicted aspartyl protease
MRGLAPLVVLLATGAWSAAPSARDSRATPRAPERAFTRADSIRWPSGTELLRFENIEGIVLVRGTLRGPAGGDTAGPIALDTGAGYLALDLGLARLLGLADSAGQAEAVDIARLPLTRIMLGSWAIDQVEPVLTVDAGIVRRVSDRPVLGLIGHKPLRDRAIWIDYQEKVAAFIPAGTQNDLEPPSDDRADGSAKLTSVADSARAAATSDSLLRRSRELLAGALTPRAVPVRFALVGDGKILVHGTVSDPVPPQRSERLNLLIDTGATKCVLFEDALEKKVAHADRWPALRGLSAPTLIGAAEARIARVPEIRLDAATGPLRLRGVDAGVIRSELGQVLSRVTRETIHGLIGYSFLKRFRVVVDYPHRVLWLDPIPDYRDDRPLEYCHVGIQIERHDGAVVVTGVATNSPAARAGVARGDELVTVDGIPARPLDMLALIRRMEGEPGRSLTLVIRRGTVAHTYRLVRRRLL